MLVFTISYTFLHRLNVTLTKNDNNSLVSSVRYIFTIMRAGFDLMSLEMITGEYNSVKSVYLTFKP